jgi:hypothetical protein
MPGQPELAHDQIAIRHRVQPAICGSFVTPRQDRGALLPGEPVSSDLGWNRRARKIIRPGIDDPRLSMGRRGIEVAQRAAAFQNIGS